MKELLVSIGSHTIDRGVRGLTSARVERADFTSVVSRLIENFDLHLAVLFGTDDRPTRKVFGVHAIFRLPEPGGWFQLSTDIPPADARYESVTKTVMAAHWYERSLQDMFGIVPEGHPDPRRLVHHENIPEEIHPLRKDFPWNADLPHADVPYPMHHVEGEGIYEIPVGPIHAGVIEPGHFRFNVAGERIITLEGKLFFTHKGVEKLLEGKNPMDALPFIERISGDASASHALAFCQALETLMNCSIPPRARFLRTIVCELERLTMHIHDIANIIGNGTGYSIVGANGFRVKERLMRLSHRLLSNRFWRGLVVPGGCSRDISKTELGDIRTTVKAAHREVQSLFSMALQCDALRERLETTGVLRADVAKAYGALGPTARASGMEYDVRRHNPYAAYGEYPLTVVTETSGDVYARVMVRIRELKETERLLALLVGSIPSGDIAVACQPQSGMALGAVESWRGEILTIVRMEKGVIDRCVVRDPSFCNWPLFGEIGPGNIVPDFPLCNKSLNLSYSGTDL